MGRLSNLRVVDQVLTTIARGYSNTDYIGNQLFPVVNVDKEGGKIPLWGKEKFRLWNTARALRADSNEMDGAWLSTISYALTEHDVQQRLDYREIAEAMLNIEAQAAQNVMDQVLLGIEKEQADIAQDVNTYPAANKVTLSSTYFNTATTDWIQYINDKKVALSSIIAKDPNTLIIPRKVWAKLKFHPLLKSYISVAPTLWQSVANVAKLQEIFEMENVLIGGARYSNDGLVFDDIWGNNIILAYVKPPSGIDRTPYEPSFGYTLRHTGYPYADKYQESNGKINVVRTTDNYAVKVVGAESGYLITNPIDPAVF